MSCLLSARETLFARLTAAGGALFAAWIAWSAVRAQTEFAMARDAAAREDRARGQVTRAKMEIEGLRLTVEQINKLLANFRDPGASSERSRNKDSDLEASRSLPGRRGGKCNVSKRAFRSRIRDGQG